ncbi:MAG: succinylglutamate desuccinylase/aspartoacylase family protein [Candidatus Nanohaloarchaea archaeon]|nr:succinylglutamate desuccinylase/aspartoacylase family protein [Candidatus Nanohaloarchaea archaeon]
MRERRLVSFSMLDGDHEQLMYERGSGSPTVLVVGGIHGDETPSIQVAQWCRDRLDSVDGTLNVIPEANVFACKENTRDTPWPKYEDHESEERNMNRCFEAASRKIRGEDVSLNLTESMAKSVLEQALAADYVIDLHTATWPDKKLPQTRIKVDEAFDGATVAEMERMAMHAGLSTVLKMHPGEIGGGVLAAVAPKHGVPAVTLEIGGASHFDDEDRVTYTRTVENILAYLGVVSSEPEQGRVEFYQGIRTVYTSETGVFQPRADIGDVVEEGDVLAQVRGRDGTPEEQVRAPVTGTVESLNRKRVVNEGSRAAKIVHN